MPRHDPHRNRLHLGMRFDAGSVSYTSLKITDIRFYRSNNFGSIVVFASGDASIKKTFEASWKFIYDELSKFFPKSYRFKGRGLSRIAENLFFCLVRDINNLEIENSHGIFTSQESVLIKCSYPSIYVSDYMYQFSLDDDKNSIIIDGVGEILKLSDTVIPETITSSGSIRSDLANELARHIGHHFLTSGKAEEVANDFFSRDSNLLELLDAVQELRDQFQAERGRYKPKYPGRVGGIDPLVFLKQHYGNEMRDGTIGAGALATRDRALHAAAERKVAAQYEGKSLQDYFDSFRAQGKEGTLQQRKYAACAKILNSTRQDAAKYFGAMKPERTPVLFEDEGPSR